MPFWKPKKKKKTVHKAKPDKSLPKYEPKPFIPPEIPKIDISANQQKESQKPAPKKSFLAKGGRQEVFHRDIQQARVRAKSTVGYLEGLCSDDCLRILQCC